MSPPSVLWSCCSSSLTFDSPARLGVDPGVDLSIGLVLVGGAYGVPQVPVPQTCGQREAAREVSVNQDPPCVFVIDLLPV